MSALPPAADQRLHSLDILRGLALFGMILVHFHQRMRLEVQGLEDLIGWGVYILIEQKAWGTFAFLFGVGFAVLLRRLEARHAPVARIYLRRMAMLAVFGVIADTGLGFHILLAYACWGLVLLVVRQWSTPALFAAALLSACIRPLVAALIEPSPSRFQLWWLLPDTNLALFILGLLAVRHRILDEPARHTRSIGAWMIFGAVAWATFWLVLRPLGTVSGTNWPIAFGFGLLQDQWLGFTYIGAVVLLLAYRPWWTTRLMVFARAGRMALTNYMIQAVVIAVLSGNGIALRLRPYAYVPAAVALFGAEALISQLWLARFRYGPLEWLWRSVTYATWQPLRRPPVAAVDTAAQV
jgi:uncharacterized protein